MDFWVKVVIIAIILHLLVGFGWLAFKLLPRKKSRDDNEKIK
jgi:hypothetical protein